MTNALTCLAIETATTRSTVAACKGEARVERVLSGSRPGAGEIYAVIEAVLEDLQLDRLSLQCIAFGCGPGSFTGVRIAAAVAQGLAFGLQVPVCRESTLALLAAPVLQQHPEAVVAAALDARQNEAYLGLYRLVDGVVEAVGPDTLVPPSGPDEVTFAEQVVLAGPGFDAYPELSSAFAGRILAEYPEALPAAATLLDVAQRHSSEGKLVNAVDAQPNYLRDKVWD